MKRSHAWIGGGLLTVALLWAASPGAGQPPGPGGERPRSEGAMRGLDLSEAQQTQIREIREKAETKRLELRKELARAENALKGEFLQDEPDAKRVREQVERIGAIRTKLELQRAEDRLAFRKVLTPAQRDRLLAMGEHVRAGRSGRPHWGKGRSEGCCARGPGEGMGRGAGCDARHRGGPRDPD
jgi:Spy/CpxP family protein refolding chaperone